MEEEDNTRKSETHWIRPESTDHEVCPVCLLNDVDFVKGKCHHSVCLPCLERILVAPIQRPQHWEPSVVPDDDAHLDVPTRGRCPICRSEICLFDLVRVSPNDDSTSRRAITKNHEIFRTDLKGRVYVQDRSLIGDQSFHFPPKDETMIDGDDALPYIDFCKAKNLKFDGGGAIPEKKIFERDCHFHEPTRTFHGCLKWGDTCDQRVSGSLEWEYALAFSSDFQFVSRGVLSKKRHKCSDPKCQKLGCKFPLDGRWRISWPNDPNKIEKKAYIHNNVMIESPQLQLDSLQSNWGIHYEDNYPTVVAYASNITYKAETDLLNKSIGVGESLEFLALSSQSKSTKRMIWTRESCEPNREYLTVLHFGARPSDLHYHLVSADGRDKRHPKYNEHTIWGNTFCQGFMVGLASYHFMQNIEQGAYISYEHERTSMWPPLDNGNPIPCKIWFTETSFDPETRTFCGKIDWEGKHGTTWQGNRWWR